MLDRTSFTTYIPRQSSSCNYYSILHWMIYTAAAHHGSEYSIYKTLQGITPNSSLAQEIHTDSEDLLTRSMGFSSRIVHARDRSNVSPLFSRTCVSHFSLLLLCVSSPDRKTLHHQTWLKKFQVMRCIDSRDEVVTPPPILLCKVMPELGNN